MTKAQYRDYLRSPRWQAIRRRILARGGGRCEELVPAGTPSPKDPDGTWRRCERTARLQVHHRTYARVGAERDEDLILLCVRCHVMAHLEALSCARCDEPIFDGPQDAWDYAEDAFDAEWWAVNAGFECEAAGDEVTWLEQWPYCHYCDHMLHKDD